MFNDRLRITRMARDFTMQQMADELHMTLRNYQRYEGGHVSPTLEGLVVIADILDVPTDFLLGRDEYLKALGIFVDVSLENPPRHPTPKKMRSLQAPAK